MRNILNFISTYFVQFKSSNIRDTLNTRLKLLTLFTFSIFVLHSCKKIDNLTPLSHEENFAVKFFTIKSTITGDLPAAIENLKQENNKTGFVNKLPANCGLPIWDKALLPKPTNGEANDIVIPLTLNNTNLSSIIVAHRLKDSYEIRYYSVGQLYDLAHQQNFTPAQKKIAENDLRLFFFLENRSFGTKIFYHIPADLFADYKTLDSEGNKTIEISKPEIQVGANIVYHPCVEWEV
jgi:hypothetical protein